MDLVILTMCSYKNVVCFLQVINFVSEYYMYYSNASFESIVKREITSVYVIEYEIKVIRHFFYFLRLKFERDWGNVSLAKNAMIEAGCQCVSILIIFRNVRF